MKESTYHAFAAPIKGYAKHMSVESAIAKMKATERGRCDFLIDDVVSEMKRRGDI